MDRRWYWFGVLAVLAVIDGIQTVVLLSDLGVRSEANPLMNVLITRFGFAGMWALKVLTLVAVGVYLRRFSRFVVPTLNTAMLLVVVNNAVHLQSLHNSVPSLLSDRSSPGSAIGETPGAMHTGRFITTDEFVVYLAPDHHESDFTGTEGL